MVNQLCSFLLNIQLNITNLSAMTSEKSIFLWRDIHTEEFSHSKHLISNVISLTSFNFSRKTFVMTNVSKKGVRLGQKR